MPILDDIMDHEVLGREFKKGLAEGELKLFRQLVEKRFGPLPEWATKELEKRPTTDIESFFSQALLAGATLDDLLARIKPVSVSNKPKRTRPRAR